MNTYHFWCYICDKRDEKLVYFNTMLYLLFYEKYG